MWPPNIFSCTQKLPNRQAPIIRNIFWSNFLFRASFKIYIQMIPSGQAPILLHFPHFHQLPPPSPSATFTTLSQARSHTLQSIPSRVDILPLPHKLVFLSSHPTWYPPIPSLPCWSPPLLFDRQQGKEMSDTIQYHCSNLKCTKHKAEWKHSINCCCWC